MKIKCIDNFQAHNELTMDKMYDVLLIYPQCYVITNDKGIQDKYMKDKDLCLKHNQLASQEVCKQEKSLA